MSGRSAIGIKDARAMLSDGGHIVVSHGLTSSASVVLNGGYRSLRYDSFARLLELGEIEERPDLNKHGSLLTYYASKEAA